MRIWRRKTKKLYNLHWGEKLEKCPEDAKLVVVHYYMGYLLFYLQAECYKSCLISLGDDNSSAFYSLLFQTPNQTDKCYPSRACLGKASFFLNSNWIGLSIWFYSLSHICHSFLPFPGWTSCSVSLLVMNCNYINKRRKKITFSLCIYSHLYVVSMMDHTLISLRYALAMHHRIKMKHIWNGMFFQSKFIKREVIWNWLSKVFRSAD